MSVRSKLRDFVYKISGLYISKSAPKLQSTLPQTSRLNFGDTLTFSDLVAAAVSVKPVGLSLLQVGAYDVSSFDPIYKISSVANVKLVLIEPNAAAVNRLRTAYKNSSDVTIIESAIIDGNAGAETNLYRFSEEAVSIYPDFGGTSSLSLKHLEDAFARNKFRFDIAAKFEDLIVVDTVSTLSSEDLLNKYDVKGMDVVVIDTEGADWLILKSLLSAGLRPSLLLFESRFLKSHEIEEALLTLNNLGYLLRDLGNDTAAIRLSANR